MTDQTRVRGYVLGQDPLNDVPTWKVCITDDSSPLTGEKIFVASVANNLQLVKGLEVTFLLGAFGGRGGETYYKALEVAPAQVIPNCDFCKAKAEILIEISEYEDRGSAEAMRCCMPHFMRAIQQGQSSPIIKAKTKLFRVINIAAGDRQWRKLEGVF